MCPGYIAIKDKTVAARNFTELKHLCPQRFRHLAQIEQFTGNQLGATVVGGTVHIAHFRIVFNGVVQFVVHLLQAVQRGAFTKCQQIFERIGHD